MNKCHFCKDEIPDDELIEVKQPDDTLYFCEECMEDILTFFKSGKAEKAKDEKNDNEGYIDIEPTHLTLFNVDRNGSKIQKISNVRVIKMSNYNNCNLNGFVEFKGVIDTNMFVPF